MPYGFGLTWGWVNDDRTFKTAWTLRIIALIWTKNKAVQLKLLKSACVHVKLSVCVCVCVIAFTFFLRSERSQGFAWGSPGWLQPANLIFHVEPSWLWPGIHQHTFPEMSPRLTPTLIIGTLSSTLIRVVLPYVRIPSVTTSRCITAMSLLE